MKNAIIPTDTVIPPTLMTVMSLPTKRAGTHQLNAINDQPKMEVKPKRSKVNFRPIRLANRPPRGQQMMAPMLCIAAVKISFFISTLTIAGHQLNLKPQKNLFLLLCFGSLF
jgi:hypothetical protein